MGTRLRLIVLAAIMGVGCGNSGELTRERAASLIVELEGFKRDAHVKMQTETPLRSLFKCEPEAEVRRAPLIQFLSNMGWIDFESRSTIVGMDIKADCPSLRLTASGKTASANWQRTPGSQTGETMWIIPIGRRELVQVTGLSAAPDGSTDVEYEWKWVANETGTALRRTIRSADAFFDRPQKSRASCRKWDDGWRCRLGMWRSAADGLGEFSPPRVSY